MSEEKVYMEPNLSTPNRPISFNADTCNGCNKCVKFCLMDVLYPNPEKGKPPIVLYPEECYYCGSCVMECPIWEREVIKPITFKHPMMQRVRWKRKATGEHYRVGMKNPPPPVNKPPVGGWKPRSGEQSR